MWDRYDKARWRGARDNAHEKLYELLRDPSPEVRAAAVFALGTFLYSCADAAERTQHANELDHAVALHLLNTVLHHDASPLVRAELVVSLHYVVKIFEANFVSVVSKMTSQEESLTTSGNLTTSQSHIIGSSGNLSSVGVTIDGGGSTLALGGGFGSSSRISPSVSSPSLSGQMLRSSSGLIFGSGTAASTFSKGGFYQCIYEGFVHLANDPCPRVSDMAETMLLYLKVKSREKDQQHQRTFGSIMEATTASVPSSPARPSFLLGGSPPTTGENNRNSLDKALNSSSPSTTVRRNQRQRPNSGTVSTSSGGSRSHNPSPNTTQTGRDLRAPELKTKFLPWCSKYFTKQLMRHQCVECDCDHESPRHWMKEWLYKRNLEVRSLSEKQREMLKTSMCKLDEPVRAFKTGFTPTMLVFHPYNHQLAVGGTKTILVQDLATNSPVCSIEMREKKRVRSKFTSLAYLNAHEHALLLAGSDDGILRVYKDLEDDRGGGDEASGKVKMVTAWNALPQLRSSGVLPHAGLRAAWEQRQRVVAVGGGQVGLVRLWDASTELRIRDLAVDMKDPGYLSCLSFSNQSPHLLVAGFADGSVCLFDTRPPAASATTLSYREHSRPVLDCQAQDVGGFAGHLVSGSSDGEVRVVDSRRIEKSKLDHTNDHVVKAVSIGQPVSSLTVHKRAFAVAAWPAVSNPSVVVHSLLGSGSQLNAIRLGGGEGLLQLSMHRRAGGPVGSLDFHPHLLQLATGPADGNVGVYRLRRTM